MTLVNSPSHFWPESRVSVPVLPHLHLTNMAVFWTLVPAPKLHWARRSCVVASSLSVARKESVLDRGRCHNHCWSFWGQNKESTVDWYYCGWVLDLRSQSMVKVVGRCHCCVLGERKIWPLYSISSYIIRKQADIYQSWNEHVRTKQRKTY